MSKNQKTVLVYGFNIIYQPVTLNDSVLVFMTEKDNSFENFDTLIYFSGAYPFKYEMGAFRQQCLVDASNGAIRRIKEIRLALEQGKNVCFIGNDACDYVVSGVLHSFGINEGLLQDCGKIYSNIIAKRSEFKPFLDSVGATRIYFNKDQVDDVICVTNYDNLLGFSKNIGKGKLFFVPCTFGSNQMSYIVDNLENLVQGLDSFSAKKITEAPSYIESFKFKNEAITIKKIKELTEQELKPLEEKVSKYTPLKRILWLGDNGLVNALREFLETMRIKTKIAEIFEEDFWCLKMERK
ncbi:MAG: hypothetical protein M1490_02680 [Candidatus Bathyarchaeota archaeon]|nr:hypothetical protein [Candidatus Bathyarchaeota archaeon]